MSESGSMPSAAFWAAVAIVAAESSNPRSDASTPAARYAFAATPVTPRRNLFPCLIYERGDSGDRKPAGLLSEFDVCGGLRCQRHADEFEELFWPLAGKQSFMPDPASMRLASAKAEPSKAYAVAATPPATPDPAKAKAEYALLQDGVEAKQSALAAEKQRIE